MSRLEFDVVDVFTDRPFSGNPLAVVAGGEGLATEQMQAMAREFHLSETAFPLRPTAQEAERGVTYRLRIFTPVRELPFAGHPSVGTAWLMAARGRVPPGLVVQACGAGDLPLQVAPDGGSVTLTGGSPSVGAELDGARVAAAVGLRPEDLAGPPAQLAGAGIEYCYLHVTAAAVGRARLVDPAGVGDHGVYVVGWPGTDDWPLAGGPGVGGRTGHGAVLRAPARARLFANDLGGAEDPATGSAALGLAVQAVACGLLPADGPSSFEVSQGVEVGRPSRLHVQVDAAGGRAVQARVSGQVVHVSSGTIAVP